MFNFSRKITSFILAASFVIASVGFSTNAYAKTTSELRQQRDKIQQQIDAAQSKINSFKADKAETEEYLSVVRSKIDLLQDKIDTLEGEKTALQNNIDAIQGNINNTEAEIEKIQVEIDKKQKEFDEGYALYCERLRAMYVSGTVSNLEILLECQDMSTMLTRSQMIKSVAKQDSDQLDSLMKKMAEIEAQKVDLEKKMIKLKEDKEKLVVQRQELQSRISDINTSKSELDAQANEANELLRKISAQTNEYMELIETNREQLAQVEDEIRRATASASTGGGSYGSGSGRLGYPTNSRVISAGYPNYSSGGYHGGIDFPVSTGSNIYAAGSGTVILVKRLGYSYGHYLVIDHGDGLSTLYAHNSQILVSPGQQVSAGQVVAKSGNTGNSTGPHCHFEVRVNGSRVNPYSYL